MRLLSVLLGLVLFGLVVGTVSADIVPIGAGDCNGDGKVNAGDITAVVLEIHDGDGRKVKDVQGGTFVGTSGCDADGNGRVNRKDIYATINVIFNG